MNNWNNNNFSSPLYGSTWDRPNTNITYVTSLEEALSRSNMRNSENVYFHQDLALFYRIKVEQDGRKYWQEFQYSQPKPVDNTPVVKQDLVDLEGRIKQLENLLFKEVSSNEQSDGQVSVPITINNDSSAGSVSRS